MHMHRQVQEFGRSGLNPSLLARIGDLLQIVEGINAGGMAIAPDRRDGVSADRIQTAELEGGRGERFFRAFIQVAQHVHLAFAAGAGAGPAKPLQADKTFAPVFPLDRQFIADLLNVHRSHEWKHTPDESPLSIFAEGKDVIVIGGGDTGTDCVGTAMRHGCKTLVQVEILPRPPEERALDNPWPEWPKVYRLDYAQEAAAAKFGTEPRVYLTTAKKFGGDGDGHVKAVHLVTIRWERNDKGQFVPKELPETERAVPAQLVLLAMGFLGPEQPLLDALGVERDPRTNVKAEYGKYQTNILKVFAAGDCRRGQSLVVWAFNEGRRAARECDRFLMDHTDLP